MSRERKWTGMDWKPSAGSERSWDHIHAELLMDIRDELRKLNNTLGCYRMQRMSDDIHRIDKRLLKQGLKLR